MTEVAPQKNHVVVIGGGYAGVIAANHLRPATGRRHHAGQPAAVVRRADPAAPAGRRLRRRRPSTTRRCSATGIRLVVDAVERHRPAARASVTLASGAARRLRLPDLRGGQHAAPHRPCRAPPNSRTRSPSWSSAAAAARRARPTLPLPHRVTVVGGGLDRHRDRRRAGRAGPPGDAGVRPTCSGPYLSAPGRRSVASGWRRLGVDGAGRRRGGRGAQGRRGARRRSRAAQRRHDLDGGLQRAGPGRAQRAAHRRAGPAAHRRDADQRRRPAHRGRGGRRRTVGPAAADELPGRRSRSAPRPPTRC